MSVARQAATGVAWNIAAGLSVRALGLAGTLFLTRFVAPGEFGDVSAAVVAVSMATQFANFNLGAYVMTHPTDSATAFQAFVYHMAGIVTACLAVTVFRYPIADALGSPGMTKYVPWLALATVLMQASRIPEATLYRALRFRALAFARSIGEVIYTVVSVGLAPFLRGGAIVAGNLARAATFTGMIIARSDRSEWLRRAALRRSTAREMLGFGFPLSAKSLAESFAVSWDKLLISRFFGSHSMGQYALAYNLADVTAQVADYIGDVLQPSLSKLDVHRQRLALPRVSALMALVLFPLIAGMAVVAPVVTTALLDSRWAGVAPMLSLLCLRTIPLPLTWVVGAYFTARRRTQPMMFLGFVKLAFVVGLLLTVGRRGPLWACAAVVMASQLTGFAHLLVGWRLEELKPGALFAATIRPLVASALMAGAVLLFRGAIHMLIPMPAKLALVLEVGVGGVAYAASAMLVARPTALEFVELVRGVLSRRTSA
jgi:PST family polysaccharide transporter